MTGPSSAPSARRQRAVETFGSAAAAIGPIVPGLSLFLVTRGQFSMLDMVQYADAFLEYAEASKNIGEHGAIVQHPRTSNPNQNPYLEIRDRALRKLQGMVNVKAEWLR